MEFTPRKFILHPESASLIVIETDHNAYTEETKASRKLQMAEEMREAAGEDEQVNRTLFKMQIKFVFTIASFLYFHLRI